MPSYLYDQVHIKEYMWTVRTCPPTILHVSMCVNCSTEGHCKEDLCHMQPLDLYVPHGVNVGEGGSLSYWHDTDK